jgi:Ca2+-binding EF-hand superfamily protein
VSADEIKEVLCSGEEIEDEVWEKIVADIDGDGNGEIDFEEFSTMM